MRRIMVSLPAALANKMAESTTAYRWRVPSVRASWKKAAETAWIITATEATAAALSELALKENRAFRPLSTVRVAHAHATAKNTKVSTTYTTGREPGSRGR